MPFNPSEHMIKLKGKDYLQVMWRLCWFREEKPGWCIDTQLVSHEGDSAVFCAKILDEEGAMKSSGYGSESKRDFGDYLEKAETKAVGKGSQSKEMIFPPTRQKKRPKPSSNNSRKRQAGT